MSFLSVIVAQTPIKRAPLTLQDGGGIRGYSSLVILGRLMEEIRDIEIREAEKSPEKIPEGGHSSYAPRPYVQCIDNGEHAAQGMATTAGDDCCRYIPCHYFDYIGGTSTGGYDHLVDSFLECRPEMKPFWLGILIRD